jgi:actin-binding LIM protein
VEGEVVSALGNTFHQKCFTCARCRKPFPTGERVTFTGKNCLCQKCIHAEKELDARLVAPEASAATSNGGGGSCNGIAAASSDNCAGCGQELKDGQALVALDKQYHIWCFKCTTCAVLLHGEYMGHEGRPYCEKDYHEKYGVKCAYCNRFISGKVLQAGDNNHFHPTCARCSKCGDPFGDGEEMYLQGTAIWHPRCGPGPGESGFVINGFDTSSMAGDGYYDGLSSTMSELHYGVGGGGVGSRASSPGGSLVRDYRSQSPGIPYAYSYLRSQGARSVSSLRRPIDPYDRKTSHPPMHFHVPDKSRKGSVLPARPSSRTGMRALVNNLQATSPRPRSPHMNNEEPIEMSHYPDGKRETERVAPIERDDFPAPPFLYADLERRRRWSEPMKKEQEEEADSPGVEIPQEVDEIDAKLRTQEETLRKISNGSSMGRVFLDTVKQREKINAQRRAFIDPRSYARTPSATREPQFRLRYDSPVNASPSRISTHERPPTFLQDEEPTSFFRSSSGRSLGTTTPSGHHHTMHSSTPSYRIVSSHGGPPKPGYTRKTSTLPSPGVVTAGVGRSYNGGSLSPGFTAFEAGLEEKNFYSTEFSSRSDVSEKSYDIADGRVSSHSINRRDLKSSTTYTQGRILGGLCGK